MSRRSPKRTAGQPGWQLNPLLEVLAHGLHHRHPRGHGPVVVPAAYLFGLRGFAWSDEQPDVKVQKTTIIFYKKCSWSWKYSVSHHLFHRPQFYIRGHLQKGWIFYQVGIGGGLIFSPFMVWYGVNPHVRSCRCVPHPKF